jgi:hypothetical protein
MTNFIEIRDGVGFGIGDDKYVIEVRRNAMHLVTEVPYGTSSSTTGFGFFVGEEWEVVRPYPTDPFKEETDPGVIAVLVKRSKRYRTALAASAFIKAYDLHEEPGPVHLQAHFRNMGGTIIQPGGLSARDAQRFPGRTARIHGPGDITFFLQEGEDKARRRELMALIIAAQELQSGIYEEGYYQGYRDLCLGNARWTHPDEHFFAAMLLVPEDYALRASNLVTARMVAKELLVDAATVQDAHQLWDLIINPEMPTD